jgi:Tol biopolymer transport system component
MPFRYSTVSRDGKQILALGETMRGELNVYDTQAQEFRPYLNGISAGFVEFSRDRQWVTYVAYPDATLWRSRVDGTERLQLTTPSLGVILNPRWSPDGKFIVFMSWGSVEIDNRIYLVSADGGAPMLLLSGDFSPSDPTWSPDGKSIAYGGSASLGEDIRFTEIRILNLETRRSTIIPGSKGFYGPRWFARWTLHCCAVE